jgi:glycerol uptake facilitator-like aquaporin
MKFTGFAAAFLGAAFVLGILVSGDPAMQETVAYVMIGVLVGIGLVIAKLEGGKPK